MTGEGKVHPTVLQLLRVFFAEILEQTLHAGLCRRNEVDRICLWELLSHTFKSLNVIKVCLVHVEEFAARGENLECRFVHDKYLVVFGEAGVSPCIVNHVVQDAVLGVAS